MSLPSASYTASALKRELNFSNGYLSLLYFCTYLSIIWYHSWCRILGIPIVVVAIQTCFAGVLSTVILSCLLILFYGQNVFHFLSSFCWQNMAQNIYEGTYQSHYKTEKKNLIKNVHSSLLRTFGLNATSPYDSYLPLTFGKFAVI